MERKNEIRKIMNLMEAIGDEQDYRDGVSDLSREGGENPSPELAKEIADDYSLDLSELMKRFEAEKARQANSPEAIAQRNAKADDEKRNADRAAKAAEYHAKVNPEHVREIEAFVDTIQTPEGFSREEGKGSMAMDGEVYGRGSSMDPTFTNDQHFVKFESEDVKIMVNVGFVEEQKHQRGTNPAMVSVEGHTNFKTPHGWKTFSRRGIDDSFSIGQYGTNNDPSKIDEVIQGQIQRAQEAISKSADTVVVPGLPGNFTIKPNEVRLISDKLKSGKTHTFAPGGMGTAYVISTKPLHKPISGFNPSPEGPEELSNFFGVPRVYITQQDHD